LYNRTSVAWIVYDDSNYTDRAYCVFSGYAIPNLGASPYAFGDKISSAQRRPTNECPAGIPIMV
jgi:hypothetical protein